MAFVALKNSENFVQRALGNYYFSITTVSPVGHFHLLALLSDEAVDISNLYLFGKGNILAVTYNLAFITCAICVSDVYLHLSCCLFANAPPVAFTEANNSSYLLLHGPTDKSRCETFKCLRYPCLWEQSGLANWIESYQA